MKYEVWQVLRTEKTEPGQELKECLPVKVEGLLGASFNKGCVGGGRGSWEAEGILL